MDDLRLLSTTRGYFLRREALALGVADRDLTRGVRRRMLVRIRHGAYCHRDVWETRSAADQHLARAHAAQDLTPGPTALSHISALAHYGAPLWRVPLDRVHLTRLDEGSSRHEGGVTHHHGELTDNEVVEVDGRIVTSPTRSTLDGLTLVQTESGLVAGDWMLAERLTDADRLWTGKERMNHWPRTLKFEVVLRLLDGDSKSVGESRSRYLFWQMGLPRPELQYPIHDRFGTLIAITDFAWPRHHVFGEFDGRVKYGRRLVKEDEEPGDVVFAEKRREDAIRRATGGTVVRFTWADLFAGSEPARQLRASLRRVA
jgi:hypothetical protein